MRTSETDQINHTYELCNCSVSTRFAIESSYLETVHFQPKYKRMQDNGDTLWTVPD